MSAVQAEAGVMLRRTNLSLKAAGRRSRIHFILNCSQHKELRVNIQDWGAIGELLGAIATVATLVYLAIQIRGHNSLARRQALDNVLEKAAAWNSQFNANPELLDIYLDGKTDYQSFDEKKQLRYHAMMTPLFVLFEGGVEHAKDRAVKPELVEAMRAAIARELEPPGARAWWEDMGRLTFSRDFAELVDSLVQPH
jgi:hypothetical protein